MKKPLVLLLMSIALFFGCSILSNTQNPQLPKLISNMKVLELPHIDGPMDYFGYPHPPSKDSIRSIIEALDVKGMDSLVQYYDLLSRNDYRYEYHVRALVHTLSKSEAPLKFLIEWQQKLPNSPYVLLAYGRYYIDAGLKARGTGFYNTVEDKDRKTFKGCMDDAYLFLNLVHEIDPLILYQWNLRFMIAQGMGADEYGMHSINESLKINPYQFLIRSQFQDNLMPRWGGSRTLMGTYADRCDSLAKYNPRLMGIRMSIYDEKGRTLYEGKDKAGAMKAYAEALSYYPMDDDMNWWVCKYYWEKKEYRKAIPYSRNLVTYFPESKAKGFYISHAKLLYMDATQRQHTMTESDNNALLIEMKQYNELVLVFEPTNTWALNNKRWYDQFL